MTLTEDTYEAFGGSTVGANIARVGSGKTTPKATAVTSNQVLDFNEDRRTEEICIRIHGIKWRPEELV
jgi:hypothetical protein